MSDKKNELNSSLKTFDNSNIKSINSAKIMANQFNTPQVKELLAQVKSMKLDHFNFKPTPITYDVDKSLREIAEINRKKERQTQDFFNNTKIIAESNVALTKSNDQIVKTSEQLLNYNEILVQQNQTLLNQLNGMSCKLNELSNEIVPCSKVQEVLGLDHSNKLDEIINLLNNPKDKNLMDKISNNFVDMPPQVLIGLVVEALKVHFGFGS